MFHYKPSILGYPWISPFIETLICSHLQLSSMSFSVNAAQSISTSGTCQIISHGTLPYRPPKNLQKENRRIRRFCHWIGLRENWNRKPRKPPYLMVKTDGFPWFYMILPIQSTDSGSILRAMRVPLFPPRHVDTFSRLQLATTSHLGPSRLETQLIVDRQK